MTEALQPISLPAAVAGWRLEGQSHDKPPLLKLSVDSHMFSENVTQGSLLVSVSSGSESVQASNSGPHPNMLNLSL